jgi:hypothetical protein
MGEVGAREPPGARRQDMEKREIAKRFLAGEPISLEEYDEVTAWTDEEKREHRRAFLQQPVIEPDEDDGLVYSTTQACRCGQVHPV